MDGQSFCPHRGGDRGREASLSGGEGGPRMPLESLHQTSFGGKGARPLIKGPVHQRRCWSSWGQVGVTEGSPAPEVMRGCRNNQADTSRLRKVLSCGPVAPGPAEALWRARRDAWLEVLILCRLRSGESKPPGTTQQLRSSMAAIGCCHCAVVSSSFWVAF